MICIVGGNIAIYVFKYYKIRSVATYEAQRRWCQIWSFTITQTAKKYLKTLFASVFACKLFS